MKEIHGKSILVRVSEGSRYRESTVTLNTKPHSEPLLRQVRLRVRDFFNIKLNKMNWTAMTQPL